MIIALDTETTGVDLAHGAMPFIVTWCEPNEGPLLMEWEVNPYTRRPCVPPEDVAYLVELLDAADVIYLHNSPFDARALATIGVALPWPKVRDTLSASHLLATNHPHDLTSLCVEYLGVDIEPHELLLKKVTQACRAIAKRDHPGWRLADEDVPGMPSVSTSSKRGEDKPWKNDMWLPRAMYDSHGDRDERWLTVTAQYACADSEHTVYLGIELERLIRERGLWAIYEHRLHLQRVACEMMTYGLTAIGTATEGAILDCERHIADANDHLVAIAREYGHDLELAQGAALNDNMRDFFYGSLEGRCPRCDYTKRFKHWNGEGRANWLPPATCPKCEKGTKRRAGRKHQLVMTERRNLGLPVVTSQKTHNATLDASAMQEYLHTTDGAANDFVRLLLDKRGHDTALSYMHAYRRFWLPVPGHPGYYRIHCSINPCGTDHLRAASNSPNLQNVSTGDDDGELSARECFGPLPDREWWRMDFKNIEKRIPAYEAQEPKLVEIFERPGEPPYWGSDHNLIASLLFPDDYWPLAEVEGEFKRRFPRNYKRCKNTNFAKQYGAGRAKCAATAGVEDAYDRIDRGLPELAKLQAHYLRLAKKTGWVQTLPRRSVDPEQGYPILASRTEDGGVLSTTPFNYHVSGTACDTKNVALVWCADQCARWRAEGFDAHVALEVHDELLFDFPRGRTMADNLFRALILKDLMEAAGDDLVPRIPTPVSVEYHTESWAEGVPV